MWLPIAILGYVINAGVYTADKYFLSKKVHSSVTYAFYVGIWSIGNVVLFAFEWYVPAWSWLFIEFLAGWLFLWATIAWYKALHQSEATKVVPIVGAFIPIFSLLLAYFFLGETLTKDGFAAILVLIAGGVLISAKTRAENVFQRSIKYLRLLFGSKHAEYNPTRRLIINSLVAAFAFAAYYVLIKFIYLNEPFIGSYIWTRIGGFIGALLLLAIPSNRQKIFSRKKEKETLKSLPLFLSIRFLAVVAFILINYAISLGNVAIINSLQGIQYVFLLIIVLVLSEKYPRVIKEEMKGAVLFQKFMGALMIGIGLFLLI
ncbi:MAG: EamA family transporter [bacterium]|nr:EamA family transporter [bacterium]